MDHDHSKDQETTQDHREEPDPAKPEQESGEDNYMVLGMSVGMCIGMSVGQLVFDEMAFGLTIGMVLGMVIGSSIKKEP